ncbi:MAG: histidine kinase dimerization/phosphoacceptor domain -containing protein [Alkalispirochaeta sp.]
MLDGRSTAPSRDGDIYTQILIPSQRPLLTFSTRYLMNHLIQGIAHEQDLNHELDHRVRNNLQLVNSLIFLQLRQNDHTTAEDALNQLNTRVMAMGAAFSSVNRTDRSFRVSLSRLLEELFGEAASITSDCCAVAVQAPIPNISISVETAVPVAIILTEMVVAGSSCEPESISLTVTSHGSRDSSVSIRFHRPGTPRDPILSEPLSRDIVTALTGHVAGFYTETPRGDDIELGLTFRD